MKKIVYSTHESKADEPGKFARLLQPAYPEHLDPALVPTPVVIFMASSTPEKIRDLRLIAETKHLPLIFEDIHKILGAFHSVDEDEKDFTKNAAKKMTAIDIKKFRTGKHAKRIQDYLKLRGLPSDAPIYFGTEDGGFAVESAVWEKTNKTGIDPEVVARIPTEHTYSGPGVETGPVISASLGSQAIMNRIIDAASEAEKKPEDVKIKEFSTLTLAPLKKRTLDKNDVYTASSLHQLHVPSTAFISDLLQHGKVSTYHYFTPENGNGKSLAEMGAEGICEFTPRSKIVDQINEAFFGISDAHYNHDFRNQDLLNGSKFHIGSFGRDSASVEQKLQELFDESGPYAAYFAHVQQSSHTGIGEHVPGEKLDAYELLSNVEHVIKDSDAAVLLPDMLDKQQQGEGIDLQALTKLYTLFSLEVNKQLNPRDQEKPVFILNHDGSWDNALAIHHDLTNSGMTKEFNVEIPTSVDMPPHMSVRSSSYFDVIGKRDEQTPVNFEETKEVLFKMLEEKRKGYTRRATKPDKVKEDGISPDSVPDFKVAVFCSASNENVQLNSEVKKLSHDLVANEMGVIYGGGDRYTMGAVLDGVKQYRHELQDKDATLTDEVLKYKAWVGGYSTKQILKSETKLGQFDDGLSYTKRTADIYQRMADMLEKSDVVVAAPGGAGTVQEWAAALILNKLHPENAKPVIFFDPVLNAENPKENKQVWSTSLHLLLGQKNYDILTSDTTPPEEKQRLSKELGIYIETTEDGVKQRVLELKKEKGKDFTGDVLAARSHTDTEVTLH